MSVSDTMTALADCLCSTIATQGLPPLCFCGVVPGEVAWDFRGDCSDANGMGWVRLTNAYPAQVVGQQYIGEGNCNSLLGFDLEVGAVRAVPVAESDGEPPDEAQLNEAVGLQNSDMVAMLKAITCCLPANGRGWLLGGYVPLGPSGGLVGGAWSVNLVDD